MKNLQRLIALLVVLTLCLATSAFAEAAIYQYGDTIEDFTVTTPEGETYTLSGLLETHKAVLLNFWFDGCGPCEMEFPFLDECWAQFKDDVAVLALSPFDDDEGITAYKERLGLSLPMAQDTIGLAERFGVDGYPTSVMIDRFGVMCFIEAGSQPSVDAFVRLFTPFAADDYTESLIGFQIPAPKPTCEMPAAEAMAAAVNGEGNDFVWSAEDDEYAWPWLIGEEGDRQYICSSNAGVDTTSAIINTTVSAKAGDALAFDYRTSTEEACDFFFLQINGEKVKAFSGENDWSSYAYSFDADGDYAVSFVYAKDMMESAGDDIVMLDDVRLLSGDDAAKAVAANPVYPHALEGKQVSAVPADASTQELLMYTAEGQPLTALDGVDTSFYLTSTGTATFKIELGADLDADAVMVTTNFDGAVHALSKCEQDDTGYLVTLGVDTMETTGYPSSTLAIYNCLGDMMYPDFVAYYYGSEADVNTSVAEEMFDEIGDPIVGATWTYADGSAAGTSQQAQSAESGPVDYRLLFVDQDGNPVKGVIANVCDDATCTPMTSDADGVVAFTNEPFAYDIHIIRVPKGYEFDTTQAFKTETSGGEMTFQLTKN